jgi:hypothetical protein
MSSIWHCESCNVDILLRNRNRHLDTQRHWLASMVIDLTATSDGDEESDPDFLSDQPILSGNEVAPVPIPTFFRQELAELSALVGWECTVCHEPMTVEQFHLTPCFHKVCYTCCAHLPQPQCPVCRAVWQSPPSYDPHRK